MDRVIVTGSREWSKPNDARRLIVNRFFFMPVYTTIVVGFNPENNTPGGADRFAYQEAQKLGLKIETHPALWAEHDRTGESGVRCHCREGKETCKAAGFRRNEKMARLGADLCLAFHNGRSRGTTDMAERAGRHGIEVEWFSL